MTTPAPAVLDAPAPTARADRLSVVRRHGPPAPVGGALDRPRLVDRLLASAGVPLVLLHAPGGFGKTTLLAEWAQRDRRPFAWVPCAPEDLAGRRVLAVAAAALDELEPLPPGVLAGLTGDGVPASAVPGMLADALAVRRRPCVLVLDGLDAAGGAGGERALRTLVAHLPAGSTLAIAARTAQALPHGRLRAQGRLVELGSQDLAMTHREAADLLAAAGLGLRPAQVAALVRRTEGWPAGLALAAMSLLEQPGDGHAVERFGGDDRLVADYLRDEVLARVRPGHREFLRRTAPLAELSGPLCDAVLERRSSGEVLCAIARSDALVVAAGRGEDRFRHHPLLADLLEADLRRLEPDVWRDVHRRAAAWYDEQGDAERALGHALRAADEPLVDALLWRVAPAAAWSGRGEALAGWIAQAGERHGARRPAVALSAALGALVDGDGEAAERWAAVAERARGGARPDPALQAGGAVLRAALAPDGVAGMAADAARALRVEPADGPLRPFSLLLAGSAAHLAGDLVAARRLLEEGARPGAVAAPGPEALCLAQLALVALADEDPEDAERLAERARSRLKGLPLERLPGLALVWAASACARAHRLRVAEAREDVATCRGLLAGLDRFAPWYVGLTTLALARAELRLSNVVEARTLLAEASRQARRVAGATFLAGLVDDAWARADTFAAESLAGPASLTTAELRVLRFLPSHLSFREIAERLHVSANTVKTQAHAVYRKLDASSRSTAVARARQLGLIEG